MAVDTKTSGIEDSSDTHDEDKQQPDRKASSPDLEPELSLWRNPAYVHWLTADTTLLLGSTLRGACITLLSYALSHSLVLSGLLTTLGSVITLALSIFSGAIVDRHPRKKLVLITAASGIIGWGLITALLVVGRLHFLVFAAIILIMDVFSGLFGGATNAMLRSVVPTRQYPKAQALNQGRDSVVNIAGSPVGGLLYGVATWLPFLVGLLCDLAAALAMARLDIDESTMRERAAEAKAKAAESGNRVWGTIRTTAIDVVEGWRWFFSTTRLVPLAMCTFFANFAVIGIQDFASLRLVQVGTSSFLLGVMYASQNVSVLLGALIAGKLSDRMPVGVAIILSLGVLCGALLPLFWLHGYWAIVVTIFIGLLLFPLLNAVTQGFIFARTPEELQGRVMMCIAIPSSLAAAFTGVIMGAMLEHAGFNASLALLYVGLGVSLAIALLSSRIRTIPAADKWDKTEI